MSVVELPLSLDARQVANPNLPTVDLGDIRAVSNTKKRVVGLVRTTFLGAIPVALASATALYFYDRAIFNEVMTFLWKAREAVFILGISLLSALLISKKTDELEAQIIDLDTKISRKTTELQTQISILDRQSSDAVNNLNIATSKLEDATNGLDATLGHLGGMVKKIKGLAPPRMSTGETASLPADDDTDYWNEVSEGWRDAKNILEDKVSKIENATKFNKYARMSRHDYRPIVHALIMDKLLDERAAVPFEAMRQVFYEYRPQIYIVDSDVWTEFEKQAARFKQLAK